MVFSKMKEIQSAMMPHSQVEADNVTMFQAVRSILPLEYAISEEANDQQVRMVRTVRSQALAASKQNASRSQTDWH
jgi:hypothetical protein